MRKEGKGKMLNPEKSLLCCRRTAKHLAHFHIAERVVYLLDFLL